MVRWLSLHPMVLHAGEAGACLLRWPQQPNTIILCLLPSALNPKP